MVIQYSVRFPPFSKVQSPQVPPSSIEGSCNSNHARSPGMQLVSELSEASENRNFQQNLDQTEFLGNLCQFQGGSNLVRYTSTQMLEYYFRVETTVDVS